MRNHHLHRPQGLQWTDSYQKRKVKEANRLAIGARTPFPGSDLLASLMFAAGQHETELTVPDPGAGDAGGDAHAGSASEMDLDSESKSASESKSESESESDLGSIIFIK